jgi:hypothetical protein
MSGDSVLRIASRLSLEPGVTAVTWEVVGQVECLWQGS